MRRLILSLSLLLFSAGLRSQELNLQDCINDCLINNPLAHNKDLAARIGVTKVAILKSAWSPGLDLNAQATWQSDVVALNLDLPFPVSFPKIPKDQYRVSADITQMIYDGGSNRQQQTIEKLNTDISLKELEVDEFNLRMTAEDLYFAILVTDKRIEVVNLMHQSITQSVSQIESGIRNGALSESDLGVVLSEKIKIEQQLISLQGLKLRAFRTLGLLMGKQLPDNTRFEEPVINPDRVLEGNRPELELFALQNGMLGARKTLLDSQRRPKILAFGQAGYGKPGLNFLGDKWDPYLMLGVRATWNIWDWGKIGRQKESLNLSEEVVVNQITLFNRNLTQAEQTQQLAIEEINYQLIKDCELVSNREKVTGAYNSRLSNGLITSSQYLNEWTKEQEARINYEVRKIEWISAQYKLMLIKGKY
jgi:outer membrane protein TolC